MNKIIFQLLILSFCSGITVKVIAQDKTLKLVFIRHAERPDNGDNLNCQGLNRSLQLPAILSKKFGKPANIYVPSLNLGNATKRTRMLQTISPLAIKYKSNINSKFDEEDPKNLGKALITESGTIFIVWEHNTIVPILKAIGIKKTKTLAWPDNDFDSIWIVTFQDGRAILTLDREELKPATGCPF